MKKIILTFKIIEGYNSNLGTNQKSKSTKETYIRYVRNFINSNLGCELTKELILNYVETLNSEKNYSSTTKNVIYAAMNSFLEFTNFPNFKLKPIKIQAKNFRDDGKDLTKTEYETLIEKVTCSELKLLIQTLASTGMRVSELKFLTLSNLKNGQIKILNKGTERIVILPRKLCEQLKIYSLQKRIHPSEKIFKLTRQQIWRKLKKLGSETSISSEKLFPHNFRHLFAKLYFEKTKNINELANLLGHKNINTTMIYMKHPVSYVRDSVERLRLIA